MANPERGEVGLDVPFTDDRTDHFILKFTNSGHRAMEDFLNMESSEIVWRINSGRLGARLVTGMFWGATRKFHRNEFPDVDSVDDYMDEIDDEAENQDAAAQKMLIALIAAYTKSNPSDIETALMGEEADEAPKGTGRGAKKTQASPTASPPTKKKASKNGAPDTGAPSSAKASSPA